MIFTPLQRLCSVALVLALSSYAAALATTKPHEYSLSLSLSGPEYVEKIQDLKIVTTITNTGSGTLHVLEDPNTVLSDAPAEKFSVVNRMGESPSFMGISVMYSPEAAVAEKAYVTLEPGQSVEVEHDLSHVYDFSSSSGDGGAGAYTIQPNKLFHIVDSTDLERVLQLEAHAPHAHIMQITEMGMFDIKEQAPFNTTSTSISLSDDDTTGINSTTAYPGPFFPNFRFCHPVQQHAILQASQFAQSNIVGAYHWLRTHPFPNYRYTTWFGWFDPHRYHAVFAGFTRMAHNTPTTRYTYDCRCTSAPGWYAFVYPHIFPVVWICPLFYHAPLIGGFDNSRNGAIIYQASRFHVNAGTLQLVFGPHPSKVLAAMNPWSAVRNAANFAYFGENRP
ncbi:zincin [Agrocybe pediades]|nr:zincin [Agrocybe pediades]